MTSRPPLLKQRRVRDMGSAEALASISNNLVYASMIAYTVAMVAFAVSFAQGRGRSDASSAVATAVELETTGESAASGSAGVGTLTRTAVDEVVNEPGRRAGNIAISVTWLAAILLFGAVVTRGISAGRVPWGNMYEFSLTSALGITLAFLIAATRRDLRWLGLFVVIPVLLTLGAAITLLYTESGPLVPALKSWWLLVHVSAAIIAGGAFTLGAAVSLLYLVVAGADSRVAKGAPAGWRGAVASRVPSAERLDQLAYRVNAFVFPLWTFAVIAGAIWAESAWGRYWGWDPKETWAFITWVVYAAYLHARATAGWKGQRAAIICLVGYGCFLFNYFGVNLFFSGLHSYSGVK